MTTKRWGWLLPAAGWSLLAIWALFKPAGAPSGIPYFDKIGHFALFFVHAVLLGWGLHRAGFAGFWPRLVWALLLWGGSSEVLQGLCTPDRSAEWLDFGADAVGIAAAYWLLVRSRVVRRLGAAGDSV